jgi:hypothetical protein
MENIGGATLPYFDGDTPDVSGGRSYSWSGTPHNSTSVSAPSSQTQIQVVTIGGAQFADIRNVVSVSRQKEDGGAEATTATVRDDASIARYLSRAYSRTDLQHQSDAWSGTVANAILASSAWPSHAPREAELTSRLDDERVPPLLLGIEPDATFEVQDTSGQIWSEGCVGWRIVVGHKEISGSLTLVDLSKWIGGVWDSASWDVERWSYAVTVPTTTEA